MNWSTELKIIAAIAVLIPLHVLEEWVFPGGFNYQYNICAYNSDQPDRYPMCRVSDMFTNLIVTFFYIVLTIISIVYKSVNTGIILGTIIFCALELIVHTIFGIKMYNRFKDKGKTTIYGPGSITAYFGFFEFGVILIYTMRGRTITVIDWMICFIVLIFIVGISVLAIENIIKKKDNPYFFETSGYFERFLK
jgi:hypothetical protein